MLTAWRILKCFPIYPSFGSVSSFLSAAAILVFHMPIFLWCTWETIQRNIVSMTLKKKFLEKVNKLIYGLALINLIPTFFSELRFKCRGWLTWGKISLKKHFEFVPLKFSKYMDIYFCYQKIWYSRTYTQSKVLRKVYQFSSVYVHNNTCLILSRKGHSRAPCWYQVSLMIYNTAVCYWFDKFFHQTSSNFNKVFEKIMDVANHIGKNWVLLSNIFLLLLMQRSQQWT